MSNIVEVGVYELDSFMMNRISSCCKKVFFNKNIKFRMDQINTENFYSKQPDIVFINVHNLMNSLKDKAVDLFCNTKSCIIAVANDIESLVFAFKINTYRAVTDIFDENEVNEILYSALDDMLRKNKILVKSEDKEQIINIEDIMYFEAFGDESIIYTENNEIFSNKSLKYWEKYLDSNIFFRSHKSYLIPLDKIKKVLDKDIELMVNDKTYSVPVSVRRMKVLRSLL